MSIDRIGTAALHLAALVVAVIGFYFFAPDNAVRSPAPPTTPSTLAEPAGAVAFLAAFGRGEEAAADRLASPLYRAEWARRGLSTDIRQGLRPRLSSAAASGAALHFTFVGGAPDDRGFGHLVYLARPVNSGGTVVPSVWRLDTDPYGRVIWAEIAYVFSALPAGVLPMAMGSDGRAISWPDAVARFHPRLIAGVRTLVGSEAYYAAAVPSASKDPVFGEPFETMAFFGVDQDGNVRPGVWSYGQESIGPSDYGRTPAASASTSDPALAALERSYAATLP